MILTPSAFFDNMLKNARAVQQHAYAPYSKFAVGTCFRAEDDTLHNGCNVENASYGMTLCAESSALSKLVSAGKKQIIEVVLVSSGDTLCPPCGRCRQLIREFADDNTCIHLVLGDHDKRVIKTYTIGDLLPASFGPRQLITNLMQGN